jgi:hypothetical protein
MPQLADSYTAAYPPCTAPPAPYNFGMFSINWYGSVSGAAETSSRLTVGAQQSKRPTDPV